MNSEKKVVEYGGKISGGYDELVQFIIGYAKKIFATVTHPTHLTKDMMKRDYTNTMKPIMSVIFNQR